MAGPAPVVCLKCLIICTTIFSLGASLTLNQGTSKPRLTKFTSSTTDSGSGALATPTSSPPTKDNSGVALYRFINSKTGVTCILLKTDALVEVKFTLHKLEEQADSFIPDNPLIEGDCTSEDNSFMRISWTGYSLVIFFLKSPGGEKWYIDKMELTVSPDLPALHGIETKGKSAIKLYHRHRLIPTPVGKSFACVELRVDLETDEEDHPPPNLNGTIFLRLIQLQPFMYKGDDFGPSVECISEPLFRDETAPIAVGSTLAIAVLMTVSGYGIYRYFKVKNVQYNTME